MNNQLFKHNNNRILLSHERKKKAVIDIYPVHHLLTYIRNGILLVKEGDETKSFSSGEFVLLKKHTHTTITKTWDENGAIFSSIVFSFQEDLVLNALQSIERKKIPELAANQENVIRVKSNPVLRQFVQSVQLFIEEGVEMDQQMAYLKTTEALIGLLKHDPTLANQLISYSVKSKADLHQYMQYHFLKNEPLEVFAQGSGRSLSTFKKDFKSVYNSSPAKWLKKKRLEHAHHLLTTTQLPPSEIYLNCGFEDLAHFSRSFKEQYGFPPSQINRTDK